MSEWERETPFGTVTVQDPFTYCRKCRDSGRPLLSFLGTEREKWSLIVQDVPVHTFRTLA
ncbi:MAG TPA: hypothetical protein ENK19_12670 [Acidobacteria bacterium]|nr:hypothetical protein [Acidobacteriota bacterium]